MINDTYQTMIDLITNQLGLKPDLIKDQLWLEVLRERMDKCHLENARVYYNYLLHSPAEMQEIAELITIPETWFYRDRTIFDYLIFQIKQRKWSCSTFKILVLACSTGEEPYSAAMSLFDAGLSKQAFSVDAVDISQMALQKARAGVYRKNSFRGKDLNYRERWFDKTESGYHIKDSIMECVSFYHANIIQDRLPFDPHAYQMIFCRNLMIYLESSAQERILELVKTYLSPDGIFVVGPAETQIVYQNGFMPIKFPGTFAFQLNAKFNEEPNREELFLKNRQENR